MGRHHKLVQQRRPEDGVVQQVHVHDSERDVLRAKVLRRPEGYQKRDGSLGDDHPGGHTTEGRCG